MPFDTDISDWTATADFDRLSDSMRITHALRISGACEWRLLGALTEVLEATGARLDRIKPSRLGGNLVELDLRVSGIAPSAARVAVERLRGRDGISNCRIEHAILRNT